MSGTPDCLTPLLQCSFEETHYLDPTFRSLSCSFSAFYLIAATRLEHLSKCPLFVTLAVLCLEHSSCFITQSHLSFANLC